MFGCIVTVLVVHVLLSLVVLSSALLVDLGGGQVAFAWLEMDGNATFY